MKIENKKSTSLILHLIVLLVKGTEVYKRKINKQIKRNPTKWHCARTKKAIAFSLVR